MDNTLSLQELMNPKRLDLQARFNNAQIAVDMAYRVAKDTFYPESKKVKNPDYVEGTERGRKSHEYDWVDPTLEEKTMAYIVAARMFKVEIEKDLNETLKVLEVQDGAKADSPKLP